MKSYSQLGEDVYCFQNFMNIPRDDVVLFEVGAFDGLMFSNTFALEEFHGCKCVLIEPSPVNVRRIYAHRPRASIHNLAIMANFAVCEFVGDSALAGVRSALTQEYVETWELEGARRYNVLSAPLGAVTELERVDYIDFLSIDVQGAEKLVLGSMDWGIPVGVICVELEGQRPEHDEACRGMLRERGFVFKARLHVSEFWVRPGYFRAGLLFDPTLRAHGIDTFEHLYFLPEWRAGLREYFY